MIYKTLYRKL